MNNTHKLFMQIKRLNKLALLKVRKGPGGEKSKWAFPLVVVDRYIKILRVWLPSLQPLYLGQKRIKTIHLQM
jgi:hypothetical protein